MSKRRREADTAADTAELDPVFVDTNLGTHLAVLLCDSDTASDFKKKVATEHQKCFPEIGEIEVHSVMVKRKSNYYHLPDIMHVKSAFHGVKSNQFLSVDASKISTCLAIRNSLERGAKSDVKNAVAEPMTVKPLEKITDSHSSPYPEEHHVETKSPAKKKRKLRHNSSLEDSNAVVRPNGTDEKPNIPDVKVSGERNDQYDVKGRLVSEGTSIPSMEEKFNVDSILNSQNLTSTNRMEEGNTFENMVDSGLGTDVLPLGAVSITVPESSARMMNAGGGGGDISTTGSKKKKKGIKKTTAKIQDTTDTEQIGKEESIKPSTVEMEEVKGLLLEDDDKVIMSSNSKSPDHTGPDLALKGRLVSEGTSLPSMEEKINVDSILNSQKEGNTFESTVGSGLGKDVLPLGAVSITAPESSATMMNAGGEGGDVITTRSKRKKKGVKKTTAKIHDTTDTEQIGKEESIRPSTVEMEEVKGLLLEDDDKVIMSSNSKSPDHVGPDLALKGRLVSEGTSLPSMEEKFNVDSILNSQNLTSTNRTEEGNTFESMVDSGLGKDVLPLGAVSITAPESSARMMNAGGGGGDVSTTRSKRKKKGVKKTTAKIQDTIDTEQIGKEESIRPSTVEMEEVKGLLLEDDDKVIMSSNSKSPDHVGPDLALKEASHLQDIEKSKFSIVNSYKHKDSDERKEDNVVESKMDYELDQDVPTLHSSGVCTNTAVLSATMGHAGGGNGDVNSDGQKRKKKKKARKSAKVKDTRDMEQIGEDEVKKPQTETIRSEETNVSLKHDKVILPSSESNYPDHVDPDLTQKEVRVIRDSDAVMEPEISNRTKKKRERKRIGTNAENLGIEEIHKDIGGSLDLPSPSGYNISKATGKDENIRLNEGMDVEMKLLDSSGHDAQEKVWELNRKTADSLQTQTEHTLENVTVGNKLMTRKTNSSVGDCHADSHTAETEYTIMESNKVDKDNENTKKKKRRSTGTKKEKLGVVEIPKVSGGSLDVPSPSHDHIPLATGKDESIRINGNNARKELLDASNHAAEENVLEVNRKEADLVESQTLENVSVLNKMMMEKSQSSAGNHHADFPTAEPENPIMESTQTNKDNENGESKYKKPTKKRRKQKHTATVVQQNSQGLSCRNEEKVDEMHELVPNTNGLKKNSEKGSEGINFTQYIVADQLQNKADYSDMVRTRSKTKSLRFANTDDVPSANIPINLQNSVKPFENKISENNPDREDTLRTKCDSAHNSDQEETSPNSVRRSLKSSKKQENGRSVLGPKVSGKPSSCKTSSGRSETLHNRRGNALLGRKISNMMQMKTPKKKISLAPGGIFQDNSGESSGDDNGTKLSKDRAISPSDSSSMSGDSEGESELSQNSASNGSTGAKAKSFSMFDFSASTEVEMTMDHLKCSDLFKKSMKVAKPIEPIQFDTDGQPI